MSTTSQPQVVLGIPHSLSSSLIASIPAGMPNAVGMPTQLNVQLVPPPQTSTASQAASQIQEESLGTTKQQVLTDNGATSEEANSSLTPALEPESKNENLLTENSELAEANPTTQTVQLPTSPQRELKRPVPIPRKKVSVQDFRDQGTVSEGEEASSGRSQSEHAQQVDVTGNEQ